MKPEDLKKWPKLFAAFKDNVVHLDYDGIDNAFDWSTSTQGCEFWGSLSKGDIEKAKELQPELFEIELDEDGFIAWYGGDMPVPEGTMVHVKYRGGEESIVTAGLSCFSGQFKQVKGYMTATDWGFYGQHYDIVAYKVVEEQQDVKQKNKHFKDVLDTCGQSWLDENVKVYFPYSSQEPTYFKRTPTESEDNWGKLILQMITEQPENSCGHSQLSVKSISISQIRSLLTLLQDYYLHEEDEYEIDVKASIYSDGSGNIALVGYPNPLKPPTEDYCGKVVLNWVNLV